MAKTPPTSDKPTDQKPAATFDVDSLDREGGTPDPFTATIAGQTFTFVDPQAVTFADLMTISSPIDWLVITVGEANSDDRNAFVDAVEKLPNWKVGKLSTAYRTHYGMPPLGESNASSAT